MTMPLSSCRSFMHSEFVAILPSFRNAKIQTFSELAKKTSFLDQLRVNITPPALVSP